MPTRPKTHRPNPFADKRRAVQRALADQRRGTRQELWYTNAWARYSRDRLKRYPWCVRHEQLGRLVPASVTDHSEPHRGDPVLFWSEPNHQSLCKRCHDAKTAREDGGFGNPRRPRHG